MNAANSMSFREGLDQFKNPKDHDFRGVSIFKYEMSNSVSLLLFLSNSKVNFKKLIRLNLNLEHYLN